MINRFCLFLLATLLVVSAKAQYEIGTAIQLKKGFIYQANAITSDPNNYNFQTELFNTQLDFVGMVKINPKLNLYSGVSFGFTSYEVVFNYSKNQTKINEVFAAKVFSTKIPIRIGYLISKKFELLGGLSYNMSSLDEHSYSSEWQTSPGVEGFAYSYNSPFSSFTTFSGQFGIQYHTRKRFKYFALIDVDFNKYPEKQTETQIKYTSNPALETYSLSYKPRLLMISVGCYYKIYGK